MILKNAKIILENETIEKGWVEITDKKIISVNEGNTELDGYDLSGKILMPGFIDCHVHGGYGVDFETGTVEGFEKFATEVAREGITKYYQASVTNAHDDNVKYYTAFKNFMANQKPGHAVAMGAHMEGPFISPERKGAHQLDLLRNPDIDLLKEINEVSGNNIKVVTYAADLQDGSFTTYMLENKILPSIGHTNESAKEFEKDYKLGARHVTHLFNAMSGVSQHEPGVATAALYHDDVLCEVISDGIHVQPETLQLIYKIKTADGICIITDAMNAKGLADGEYKLGNLEVIKTGMKVALKDTGVLAGAGATYDHNVRTYYNTIPDMTYNDLIKMTSINVAKQLDIFNITGSIEANKLADLVVMDDNLEVVMTISEGQVAFERN